MGVWLEPEIIRVKSHKSESHGQEANHDTGSSLVWTCCVSYPFLVTLSVRCIYISQVEWWLFLLTVVEVRPFWCFHPAVAPHARRGPAQWL